MTIVRKYYADWYEMYSRYPYAALSVYPSAATGKSCSKFYSKSRWCLLPLGVILMYLQHLSLRLLPLMFAAAKFM